MSASGGAGRVGRDGCCCCRHKSYALLCSFLDLNPTSTTAAVCVHPQAALVLALSRIQLAAQGAAGPTTAGSKRCVQCRLRGSLPTLVTSPPCPSPLLVACHSLTGIMYCSDPLAPLARLLPSNFARLWLSLHSPVTCCLSVGVVPAQVLGSASTVKQCEIRVVGSSYSFDRFRRLSCCALPWQRPAGPRDDRC